MTAAVQPAILILTALVAFPAGWYGCRWRHHLPAVPVVWPWQRLAQPPGRHAAPSTRDEVARLRQGRHAAPTNPDGALAQGEEPAHAAEKDQPQRWFERWPDAHLDGHHTSAPADGCMYCHVAAIPIEPPQVSEVPA